MTISTTKNPPDTGTPRAISGQPPIARAARIRHVIRDLNQIRAAMLALEARYAAQIGQLDPARQPSATNLIHYLAFRQFDIRVMQEHLASLGLSSLGRAEAHVLASIDQVLAVLQLMAKEGSAPPTLTGSIGFEDGKRLLERNTDALLGQPPRPRTIRIMVTMPTEAATDPTLIHDMLAAGMDCMRINCAHDDPVVWEAMVEKLREAERALGKKCTVLTDLAGPKLRTGPIHGPDVLKCRPRRDAWGRVEAPARVWFTALESQVAAPAPCDASIPVARQWLSRTGVGDRITFTDTRGARRTIAIVATDGDGRWGEAAQSFYLSVDVRLRLREKGKGEHHSGPTTTIGPPRGPAPAIVLRVGDRLRVTRAMQPGHSAEYDALGVPVSPATIACTLPEVFQDVRAGERIWLDDGKIGGVIRATSADAFEVEITAAPTKGARLRADKGINLPDSVLRLPALTEKDLRDLAVVVHFADMVGFSFVRNADDVAQLQNHLQCLGAADLGIILKLETRRAFEQLPHLLLAAMRSRSAGVMIARGDLAVESGFERLAEVQEEILWICEAAHLPTIWATQVLETLATTGFSTRAEITDAAMGERAECVMLNKGPYIVHAIRALDNILRRMQGHRRKGVALLRQLRSWSVAHAASPQ